jgi:Trk K+ transport system NAD-binding subunit
LVVGVSRGGQGFIPTAASTLQQGDYLIVILAKEGTDLLDTQLEPPGEHH